MKRNYKYEKEMLHWLDGGEIEQKITNDFVWQPFDGDWCDKPYWQYRIAEPAEKPKAERWLYVYSTPDGVRVSTVAPNLIGCETIGKIRMEDV